jgi:uncharacterized protein
MALFTATRLLEKHPEIPKASFQTALVCGDIERVERVLRDDPRLASAKGGPNDWEPLLYVAFTRLAHPASVKNQVDIARLLLDSGANPTVFFKAGDSDYTPLVGAVGEGEEDRPPHAHRDALVKLLLERGAEPYDDQVIYNLHFHGDVLWWLKLMHEHSHRLGRASDWSDPEWRMLSMGNYGSGARWHLWIAIEHGSIDLARWCLEHGASANAAPAADPRFSKRTLYEDALLFDRPQIAQLLAEHGAVPGELHGEDAFVAACRRRDAQSVRGIAAEHPEYVRSPKTMLAAAEKNRTDVIELLLELGASADVEGEHGERPLHAAAYAGAREATALLLSRTSDVDATETRYSTTPLGWAVYAGRQGTIDLLAARSRDVWNLVYIGDVARLRTVLEDDPSRAMGIHPADGETPLMWLPNDDARATEIVQLLLRCGADPSARDSNGRTAAETAERRGLDSAAAALRAAM